MLGILSVIAKGSVGAIQSLFSSNGKISSTRFITIVTCLTILGVYIAHNIVSMVNEGSFIDFPTNSVAIMLIVLGAKVGQHVSERRGSTTSQPHDKEQQL